MAVLLTPPFLQFFANDGITPLAYGKIYTYASGTTTPKATYTDQTAATEAANPIVLDSMGRATIWIDGSYKIVVKDALDTTIKTTDKITSFNTLAEATSAFFQSFSGNGSDTVFTLSSSLGTEEKALMVFVDQGLREYSTNGTFTTDTGWTKGAGWSIGTGVATAAGALSTAISQDASIALVAGQSYTVTFTITRDAGSLTPSIGGTAGTARSAAGTYSETIIAGATQVIAFTGASFTGTLDNVTVKQVISKGYDIINPSAYTLSGTSLTFAEAPATGTNNIFVFAPSLLLGAASAAAAAAAASATAALASQLASAISESNASSSETNAAASEAAAAAYATQAQEGALSYTWSSTTTMADPGTGNLRFNNATVSSVTEIAIDDKTAQTGNPDIGDFIADWDSSSSVIKGTITINKAGDATIFAIFNITAVSSDTGWKQITVAYVDGVGSFTNSDAISLKYVRNGDAGSALAPSDISGQASGTIQATDNVVFERSGSLYQDTVQGILDLVPTTPDAFTATTTISGTADWDSLTTAGLYKTTGSSYVNAPLFGLAHEGYLSINCIASDSNRIVQKWVEGATGETWQRASSNGGTTWSMWHCNEVQNNLRFSKTYDMLPVGSVSVTGSYVSTGINTFFTGTGSGCAIGSGLGSSINKSKSGYVYFQTGTTTTGEALIGLSPTFGIDYTTYGTKVRFDVDLDLPSEVSDGTNNYSVTVGIAQNTTSIRTTNNIVLFAYNHAENSGKWTTVTDSGGTETANDSGVTPLLSPSGVWLDNPQNLRIEYEGTKVRFLINNAVVATHTTNIPPETTALFIKIKKSAGTSTRFLAVGRIRVNGVSSS